MFVGLLMIRDEDDILEEVLATHCRIVDAFYVLDGSEPNERSEAICRSFRRCYGYWRDADLPADYGPQPRDGWRQYIYERAAAEHGVDNWFLLLHGDEVWTCDPREVVKEHPDAQGFGFRLPLYFPHVDDGWRDDVPPLEQLRWSLAPGWPEFRMFRGRDDVRYDVRQHSNVAPVGIDKIRMLPQEIRHYPFRAPVHQVERADRHAITNFDPANYDHIRLEGRTLWDDDLISRYRANPNFEELRHD